MQEAALLHEAITLTTRGEAGFWLCCPLYGEVSQHPRHIEIQVLLTHGLSGLVTATVRCNVVIKKWSKKRQRLEFRSNNDPVKLVWLASDFAGRLAIMRWGFQFLFEDGKFIHRDEYALAGQTSRHVH